MSWDRTGQTIEGLYIGKYKAVGVVKSSRIKYGGQISHEVVLTEDLQMQYEITRHLGHITGDTIIIREENVTNVIQEVKQ